MSVKVVFITGSMRSGSTILANVLGSLPGWLSVGEANFVWSERPWVMCACGEFAEQCEVWAPVMEKLRAQLPAEFPDLDAVARYQQGQIATRHVPHFVRHGTDPSSEGLAYRELRRQLYMNLSEITGASVIVDSSKAPSSVLLAEGSPEVEVYAIHLLRDPVRTVASAAKKTHWDGVPSSEYPPHHSIVESSVHWSYVNFACERWVRPHLANRWQTLRYEDWVLDLEGRTKAIRDLVEPEKREEPISSLLGDSLVQLPRSHSIAGNPSRFRSGAVKIARDDSVAVKGLKRLFIRAVTAPVRRNYGY